MANRPKIPGVVQKKIEPKTYFANERTFLSWLHMALTMGSISAAMVGFSTAGSPHASVRKLIMRQQYYCIIVSCCISRPVFDAIKKWK